MEYLQTTPQQQRQQHPPGGRSSFMMRNHRLRSSNSNHVRSGSNHPSQPSSPSLSSTQYGGSPALSQSPSFSSSGSAMAMSFTSSNVGNTGNNTTGSQGNHSSSYCSSHFMQTTHAQIRRKQRNILYKDVKAAIKFGTRKPHVWYSDLKRMRQLKRIHGRNNIRLPSHHSVYKYIYKDLIYIVDEKERKEITCYTKPIELEPIPIPPAVVMTSSPSIGTTTGSAVAILSHTVMIIDTSGSMNRSDVWGTRNRLDAVWMAIAIDFMAVRLQEQDRTGQAVGADVVTMILMKERAQVLYRCVPITWMLYNQFIHIYNQKQTIPPSGHGYFIPSLAIAEQIIDECNSIDKDNFSSNTVTSLLLLSDGVPSDPRKNQNQIMDHIQSITTKQVQINSPFLFTAIGIGDGSNERKDKSKKNTGMIVNENADTQNVPPNKYPILRQMVETAQKSGATSAQLKVPSMSCTSFGQTFSSVATSISTSMSLESSSSEPLPPRQQQHSNFIQGGFRTISLRDNDVDDEDDDNDHNPHRMNQQSGRTVPRESKAKASEQICEVTAEDFNIYPIYSITRKVCNVPDNLDMEACTFVPVSCQHPETRYVAVAKGAFDEGSERYVYRFFEVAYDGKTILGLPMVAKESRRVDNSATTKPSTNDDLVHTFCKTQQLARHLAVQFNRRLYGNPQQIPIDTPRISFLDCSVYEIFDPHSGRRFNLLVENMVDHMQWCKWNSNNGWRHSKHEEHMGHPLLEQINETEEEDDMNEDDENEYANGKNNYDNNARVDLSSSHPSQPTSFSASQIAQAFSHFTHWLTNGEYLVCDLQGIFNVERNTLQLSDPVIHSNTNQKHRFVDRDISDHAHGSNFCTNQFGRTDRGYRGIDDFFMTHRCDEQDQLCQLVIGRELHSGSSHEF